MASVDVRLSPLAQFAADMQLCTGEEWPTEFLEYILRNRPDYAEQTAIIAGTLRVLDPTSKIHMDVVSEIRSRRKKELEKHGTA